MSKVKITLPQDVARCRGIGSEEEGWRDGCDVCLRRLAKKNDWNWYMQPPAVIAFECEYLIEKEN